MPRVPSVGGMTEPTQDRPQAETDTPIHDELVEEVSIDGMCGVY